MAISCKQFEALLADALGDELQEADRRTFEDHLAACETCRAEYESASATVERVRSLTSIADSGRSSAVIGREPRVAHFWRYAATILISFTAGYGLNAISKAPEAEHPIESNIIDDYTGSPRLASASSFEAALAGRYRSGRADSDLSRCFAAMFSDGRRGP